MPIIQYASMRVSLPALTFSVLVGGGNLPAGTLYFCVQGRNRAGHNLPSDLISVTFSAGDAVEITIPSTCRETGEDIHKFTISASTSNDISTFVQIAEYQAYDSDQVTPRPLPITITLSEPDHIVLSGEIADSNALPSGSNLLEGMLRGILSLAKIYRYESESTAIVDGSTVLSASPDPGRWLEQGAFSTTQITSTEEIGGSDAPVGLVPSNGFIFPTPHPLDGSIGTFVRYWWILNRNEGAGITEAGKKLGLLFKQGDTNISALMDGQATLRINGYTRLLTGVRDTVDIDTSDSTYIFGKLGARILTKNVPTGYAIDVGISLKIRDDELQNPLPDSEVIKTAPFIYNQSGTPNPAGRLAGNIIYNEQELRRLVPGFGNTLIALSGSGTINNFDFTVSEKPIINLLTSTANQTLAINGDGTVTPEGVAPTLEPTQVIRAIVGTLAGLSNSSPSSGYFAVNAGDTLDVTISHPVNNNDKGIIRSSYPDPIAGYEFGEFNPPLMRVYIRRQSDDELREFTGFIPLIDPTQNITISNWADGNTIGTVPANLDPLFSLYEPLTPSFVSNAGASDFTADNYQIEGVIYEYDSGIQVTSIDHSSPPAIYESSRSAQEWDQTAEEWLSNKDRIKYLDERQTFTTAWSHATQQLTSTSGSVEIDTSLSNYYEFTLTENVDTITAINIEDGTDALIKIINPSNLYNLEGWSNDFVWLRDEIPTAPESPNTFSLVQLHSFDGATLTGWEIGTAEPVPPPSSDFDFNWIVVDSNGEVLTNDGNVLVNNTDGVTAVSEIVVDENGEILTFNNNVLATGASADWDTIVVDNTGSVLTNNGNVLTTV